MAFTASQQVPEPLASHMAVVAGDENSHSIMEEEKKEEEVTMRELAHITPEKVTAEAMALNDAFVALEAMRKANLEVEYGGKTIKDITVFHQYCTVCLKEEKEKEEEGLKNNNNSRRRWRIGNLVRKKKSPPCLICASPVCQKHGCREFRKEGITICGHCSSLFTMDFVVDTISNDAEEHRKQCIAHVIDSYDRSLLMLRYSCQFIEEVAVALENSTRTNDQISLGSSGIGMMSGLTGVAAVAAHFAAAATILSPAGPPLIIASILFGSTAAVASTSSEAVNYYSEPNQLANKVIALYELVHSLLAVTAVMNDALKRGHIDAQHYIDTQRGKSSVVRIKRQSSSFCSSKPDSDEDNSEATEATILRDESTELVTQVLNEEHKLKIHAEPVAPPVEGDAQKETCTEMEASQYKEMINDNSNKSQTEKSTDEATDASDTVGVEAKTVKAVAQSPNKKAPSNTRAAISRATTTSIKVASIASIALCVLSAATIVVEAKNINDTLESIKAGSPCEKAKKLRQIKEEVEKLPETKVIAEECETYLKATKNQTNLY